MPKSIIVAAVAAMGIMAGCVEPGAPQGRCGTDAWILTATIYTENEYSGGDAVLRISDTTFYLVTTKYEGDPKETPDYRGVTRSEAACIMTQAPPGHQSWQDEPDAAARAPMDPAILARLQEELQSFSPSTQDWGSACTEARTRTYHDHERGTVVSFTNCDEYLAGKGSTIMNTTRDLLGPHAHLWR